MTFIFLLRERKRGLLLLCFMLACSLVQAQLQADFNLDKTGDCSPATFTFTNATTGAGAGATYKWDLGNGNTSTLISPGATYREEKTYTITLTVTSGSQTSTKSKQVTVYKKPTVDFSPSVVKGCAPLTVDFTGKSTAGDGSIASYFWDYGDGNTGMAQSAQNSHTYTFASKNSVSLTVTNSYGCFNTLSKTDLITVLPTINADFGSDKKILCNNAESVAFSNISTGPADITWLWDFGDGKTATDKNPSHTYDKKGIYTIKLTVSSPAGCNQTVTKADYLNVANFTTDFTVPALICDNVQVVYNNASTPAPDNSYWEFDGNGYPYYYSPSYALNAGTHTIKLTNTFGTCKQTISKDVVVKANPVLTSFVANLGGVCGAPVTVSFKDTSTDAVKWLWNFDYYSNVLGTATTKETSNKYNSEGYYYVRLTTTNAAGCTSAADQGLNIHKPDIGIYTEQSDYDNCTGKKVKFYVNHPEDVTQYKWNFGDGTSSVDSFPVHIFSKAGDFPVSLDYTTKEGCKNVNNYGYIRVNEKPDFDFASAAGTTICGNTPVTFTITALHNTAFPQNSYIYYGDGSSNYDYGYSSFLHQYQYDSTYTVTVIASNGSCSDTVTKENYIKVLPPFPRIGGSTNTCDGTRGLVSFTETSNKAISGTWDFGDGTTNAKGSSPSTINHTYTKTGTFKVALTTVNAQCSVRDSTTVYVLLKQKPVLSSLSAELCANDRIDIKISSLEHNPYPFYNYYSPYYVSSFRYGDNTTFTGYTSSTGYYYWSDSVYTGYLQTLETGKKNMYGIVNSAYFGCSDTTSLLPLTIKGPVADFEITKNNVCFKLPVTVKDKSKGTNNVEIKTWEWSFNDGAVTTVNNAQPVSHIYNNPGQYLVGLKVTDAEGCSASFSNYADYATVNGPKAIINYYPQSVSPNTNVTFYNYSNTYNSYNPVFSWSLPDGTTTTDYNPNYTFPQLGSDTVKLFAKDNTTGCADTAVQVINVKNVNAAFTYATSYINNNSCPPVVVRFTNTSLNSNSVSWNFGDGGKADNQNFPSHTYYNPGVYNVTIYVVGINGTTDSTIDSVIVKGPYAKLKADVLTGCSPFSVTLNAEVRNAASFTWDFGDGSLQNTKDTFAVHRFITPGIYTPALILKDSGGCSGTSELSDKIILDTLNVSFTLSPAHICDSAQVHFTPVIYSITADQLQLPLEYKWQFGTGKPQDTSGIASPDFSYTHFGKYNVSFKASSPYGCLRQFADTVQVYHRAKGTIHSPAEICEEKTATFTATADITANAGWSWDFGNRNSSSDQNPVTQLYDDPGTFPVSLIVENDGCFDTAIYNLVVRPKPDINTTPANAVLCLGKSVQLSVSGGDIFSWRHDAGLNDYATAQPVASPTKSTTYQVEVTNTYGCKNTDSATITVAAPFTVGLAPEAFICSGKQLQLAASGAYSYEWINNPTAISNTHIGKPVVMPLSPVSYTVVGYDAYNCFTDTATVNVKVGPLPTINAGPDLELFTGSQAALHATASSDITTYSWSPPDYLSCSNCPSPVSTPRAIINYIVTGTTQHGCQASDTVHINLLCDQGKVFIPTAFTPNNDLKNDVFYIKGKGVKEVRSMRIFDRLGEVVFDKAGFQIEDRSAGWDGKYKGQDLPTGAYVYFVEMICDNGQPFTFKGTVLLVR